MPWHRKKWADRVLRAAGLLLLGAAGMVAQALFGAGARVAGLVDYALAPFGFVCASAGFALAGLGSHLFDEIALSPRWTIYESRRRRR